MDQPSGLLCNPATGKQPAPVLGDAPKQSALGGACKTALFTKIPARAAVQDPSDPAGGSSSAVT